MTYFQLLSQMTSFSSLLILLLSPSRTFSQDDWYCGTSYSDAGLKCLTPCPSGSNCPSGETCFSGISCISSSATTTSSTENTANTLIDSMINTGNDSTNVDTNSSFSIWDNSNSSPISSPSSSFVSSSSLTPSSSTVASMSETNSTISATVEDTLLQMQEALDNNIFLYETPTSEWIPSTVYRFDSFFAGLKVMYTVGVAGKKIYMGYNDEDSNSREKCPHCHMYGLVNIASFLAQAMKETIRYDACDENSWDRVGPLEMYPLSNACGQLGQSYQDYHCSDEEKHMECVVDPDMTITAVTHAKWYGAPGPLKCGPKSLYPHTGYWDYAYECNNPWANPPESCTEYEGQLAGKANNDEPYPNSAGRTDVEGCCWWGRGVIQTSGVCNFGKLNFYLGKRAFSEGRDSRYPDIDFCKDPEVICNSEEHKELKWIAGFFYWMDQVQTYDSGDWKYLDELHKFVDGGMVGEEFINAVSGIVNRGCHNPPCGTGDLDGGPERSENFVKILKEMEFSFVDVVTTTTLTPAPLSSSLPAPFPTTQSPTLQILTEAPFTEAPSPVPIFLSYICGNLTQTKDINLDDPNVVNALPSVDVVFDYELHHGLDVTVNDALEDVKKSILSDIAEKLGCTEISKRRSLQDSVDSRILGFISKSSDMPDPNAAGCLVGVENDGPSTCTPIIGTFTVQAEQGTQGEELSSTSESLKSSISDGMDSGKYESDIVKKVIYIGDRETFLQELDPPVAVNSFELPPQSDGRNRSMKIAIYTLAGVCVILLCLLCMILPVARKKRKLSHDEERAMMEYMDAQRENGKPRLNPIQYKKPNPLLMTGSSRHALENGTSMSESDDDNSQHWKIDPQSYALTTVPLQPNGEAGQYCKENGHFLSDLDDIESLDDDMYNHRQRERDEAFYGNNSSENMSQSRNFDRSEESLHNRQKRIERARVMRSIR